MVSSQSDCFIYSCNWLVLGHLVWPFLDKSCYSTVCDCASWWNCITRKKLQNVSYGTMDKYLEAKRITSWFLLINYNHLHISCISNYALNINNTKSFRWMTTTSLYLVSYLQLRHGYWSPIFHKDIAWSSEATKWYYIWCRCCWGHTGPPESLFH